MPSSSSSAPAPEARPRPWRRELRLLLPLGLAMALSLTGDSTLYAVLPSHTQVAGVTLAVVGLLLAANRIIRIPGNVVAGSLFDRFGRRRLLLSGLVLGVLSTLSYSLARGFWPLLGGRLLWGISWSLINVGGYTMVMDRSCPADRGRMMGLYQLCFALGLALSPILGGSLTDAVGFRPALQVCAAVSSLGVLVAILALPETRPQGPGQALSGSLALRGWLQSLAPAVRQARGDVLRVRYVYLVVYFVNGGIMMSTLSLYVQRHWGAGLGLAGRTLGVATVAGALLAVRSLVAMAAGPLAGLFSDSGQRSYRQGTGPKGRWPAVWLGLGLGIVGFLLLGMGGSATMAVLGVASVAAGAGASIAGAAALAGDLASRDRPGAAMGSIAAAGDLGSAAGPLVGYALAPRMELAHLYLLCAVVLLSGLLVCARAGATAILPSPVGSGPRDTPPGS